MALQSAESLLRRLAESRRALVDLRSAIEAGRPWPLGTVEPGAPEGAWGPPEILAHVAEMLPYWLGEVERVLEGAEGGIPTTVEARGGPPTPFGRVEADELRISRIHQDRTLPVRELYARIEADCARWEARLGSFGAPELDAVGHHPRRGDMTVAGMMEPFVVGHMEGHVEQLRAAIAKPEH